MKKGIILFLLIMLCSFAGTAHAAHTHTFQIEVNAELTLEGELTFNGSGIPCVKITSEIDMPVCELEHAIDFLKTLVELHEKCGEIQSIEINKV